MITRSAVKKSFSNECKITKALSSTTKSISKDTFKTEFGFETPIKAYNGKSNSEASLENIQSPVFNIHVHMPTTLTSDLNKSGQFQPIIHLHFGELVHKLSPGMTSENFEIINRTPKVGSPSEVNYNSEEQSDSNKSVSSKPLRKKVMCKKLSYSKFKRSSKNLKTEKSEAVLKSDEEIKERGVFSRNSFHKIQSPVRRSIRQENNRKLSKALKDLSPNKSITTKIETKRCKNINTAKSASLGETLNLKKAVVLLRDIMKEREGIAFQKDIINSGEEACFSCVNTNSCDVASQEEVEKCSWDSLGESDYEQNSEGKEENEKYQKKNSDNQSMISLSKKCGEIYSLVYSSDDDTNSVTDFLDNSISSEEKGEIVLNMSEPEKNVCDPLLEVKDSCGKVTKNNQVGDNVNNVLLQSEVDKNIAELKSDISILLPNDKDSSLNLKYDDEIVSMNLKSNNSTGNCNNKPDLSGSDSNLSHMTYFDKDNRWTYSLNALDMERFKNSLNSENNLVKNFIEGINLSSIESSDYQERSINTLNFQLELIKKEMKKRNMTIKEESNRQKSVNKREATQICKEASGKSPVAKKMKLQNKITKNISAEKNGEKSSSADDYIPLQKSGPTEFAVAQLSKIKPYSAHKAKNFKNEMLFGKRVNRHSNPKYLETYLLKRQAAMMRNK